MKLYNYTHTLTNFNEDFVRNTTNKTCREHMYNNDVVWKLPRHIIETWKWKQVVKCSVLEGICIGLFPMFHVKI